MPLQSELESMGLREVDNEDVAISSGVSQLTEAKIDQADFVFVTVDGPTVRYTISGIDPSTVYGRKAYKTAVIYLSPAEAKAFKATRSVNDTQYDSNLIVAYAREIVGDISQ